MHAIRKLKPRFQLDQPVVILKPIRALGEFYGDLPPRYQKACRNFARIAGTRPRPELEKWYHDMKRTASGT